MKYLLKAERVLSGRKGEVIKNGAVLVDGESIVSVGSADVVGSHIDPNVKVIDFGERTLMPGMIDCHVHLGFDGSADPVTRMKKSTDEQLLVLMLYNARLLLRSGVTTAREMGARSFLDLVVKEAIEEGTAVGPNLLVSNRPITSTGGHCWFMGCECDDTVAVKRAVRDHVKAGADFIKIMHTGGFMTKGSAPWYNQFDRKELETATYESHRLDKKIAVHAHGAVGIKDAVDVGVDTIEHCSWVTSSGYDYSEEAAEKIVEKGIHICLTTNVGWGRMSGQWLEERLQNISRMKALGMKFIAGTDAGINLVPHDKYVGGLEALQMVGLSNEEIIESATIIAAEACGIDQTVGTLAPGMRADIIAVDGNPLSNISDLWNVDWVMRAGTVPDFAQL